MKLFLDSADTKEIASLAATGLVLWIIYLASDTKGLAWVAFALLLLVASLGFAMLALWLQRRKAVQQPSPPARSRQAELHHRRTGWWIESRWAMKSQGR